MQRVHKCEEGAGGQPHVSPIIFLRQGLSLALTSPSRLGWPMGSSLSLTPQVGGYKLPLPHLAVLLFNMDSGIELSLYLQGKQFTD